MICIVGCILGWVIATFAGVCLLRELASKRKTLNGRIAKLGTEVGMMKARLMSAVKKGIVACVFALLAVSQAPASPLHFCRGCWHNRSCTPDGAKPFGFPAGVQQP